MTGLSLSPPASLLPLSHWPRRYLACIAFAALADWLFYGREIGLSAGLFLLALGAGALLTNPVRADRRKLWMAAALLVAALMPLFIHSGLLPLLFGAGGAAYFVLAVTGAWNGGLRAKFAAIVRQWLVGPARLIIDLLRGWRLATRRGKQRIGFQGLSVWAVPLVLGAVFLALFSQANPLIGLWASQIDLGFLLQRLDGPRIGFWLAAICIVWPFLHVKLRQRRGGKGVPAPAATAASPLRNLLLGERSIVRSLFLFNLLFALQTGLDVTFLWAGVTLPNGMTYAAYAHRGAYPLICTALLAAGFVLVALRPGSEAERSPLIRGLVFLWIGQNVLLVISSILRLDLYVAVYSLTWLRVAAFVWMLLVVAGLLLIIARIALSRSNGWLIGANLSTLGLTLYVCSLINFTGLIANYNVDHSREFSGQGVWLDTAYLLSLGPQAIPAIDRLIADLKAKAANGGTDPRQLSWLISRRSQLADRHASTMRDWRAWSFYGVRLQHYLFPAAADNDGVSHSTAPDGQ